MSSQIRTILSLLYAGERIKISFPSFSARETFRKRLYAEKADQDAALLVLLNEPKKILRREHYPIDSKDEFPGIYWLESEDHIDIKYEVLDREENVP